MKYFCVLVEEVEYWMEIDGNCAMRQINIDNNSVEISSFQECLSDIEIIEEDIEGEIKHITASEFNTKWNEIMKKYSDLWEATKMVNPIGMEIIGKVRCFYPQGTIVDIGKIKGLCLHEENFNVGQTINGIVHGYDEVNMWVIIHPVDS